MVISFCRQPLLAGRELRHLGVVVTQLEGKTVIVTGAGRGIGREYALRIAQDGANVVIGEVHADNGDAVAKEIVAAGGQAIAVTTDVSRRDQCEALAAAAVREFGRIDALVNNAAIFYGAVMTPMDAITEEVWDRMMAVNIKGVWFATLAVLPQMRSQQGGRIINIASSVAMIGPPMLLHYTASKGAVQAMTRSMAAELGGENIKVTAVAPGMCDTEALASILPDPALAEVFLAQQKLQRKMVPADVAPLVSFLCSDAADFVIGQNWVIDGGLLFN
jgi:NAD(P)-dependent dehydrogenase (short-subunit alcohol dehydrogenase family)